MNKNKFDLKKAISDIASQKDLPTKLKQIQASYNDLMGSVLNEDVKKNVTLSDIEPFKTDLEKLSFAAKSHMGYEVINTELVIKNLANMFPNLYGTVAVVEEKPVKAMVTPAEILNIVHEHFLNSKKYGEVIWAEFVEGFNIKIT